MRPDWLHRPGVGGVLVEGEMRARDVIVAEV